MVVMIESATAPIRFSAGNFHSSASNRLSHSSTHFFIPRRCGKVKRGIRAAGKEKSSSGMGPVKPNAKPQRYHPFEDISDSELLENAEDATLTPAETTRTIIEVNSKAALMFSGMLSDQVHDNIFWPDLPYLRDECGNIYFQVKNDEDILKALTNDENVVQIIIGLDTAEIVNEMESRGQTELDFGIFDEEDSDFDDDEDDDIEDDKDEDESDYEEDWVAILDDEEGGDEDSDESLGDWAKLDTMRSSHPIYFAKTLAEVVGDDPIDFMDQLPAGLVIQGVLRPAFVEEHAVIQKHISDNRCSDADKNQIDDTKENKHKDVVHINGHRHENGSGQDSSSFADELDKDENQGNGTSFYKLEMIKVQLISAHGHQTTVEVEDFRRARPDAIAHSAAKIISRFKASGEKTTQALRSLCWRCKGIQVEEVALIGVDSLGFDLRVCSGTQVQTLRFAFKKRASSEYSAERQLNDVLFPRIQHKTQQKKEAQQTES